MRSVRFLLLSALLLAPILGCGEEEARDPANARVAAAIPKEELPRTGIIADAPRDPIEIGVAADGTILSRGVEGGLPELEAALREETQDPRHTRRDGFSKRDVVIRASASVPWPVTAWVMQACATARLSRLHFAVMPEETGPEGVISAWLPPFHDSGGPPGPVDPPWQLGIAVFAHEGTADRGTVYAWLKGMAEKHRLQQLSIETPLPRTPRTGAVVGLLDLGRRAGIPGVTFVAVPSPGAWATPEPGLSAGSLGWLRAWVVEQKKSVPSGWKVRARGFTIDANAAPASLPPPPPRGPAPLPVALDPGLPIEEDAPQLPEESSESPAQPRSPSEEPAGRTHPLPAGVRGIDPPGLPRPFARREIRRSAAPPADAAANAAIDRGLAWLAAHQSLDGGFEAAGFAAWCDGKPNTGSALDGRGSPKYDVGVTGLALLAFLGAGHTNRSEGPIGRLMGMGLKHLKSLQDAEGCIGPRSTGHFVYDHAIGTLALVEAYAMTGSAIYKNPAQKALDFIALARNPGSAWRYGVKPGDNDTSVTAWMFLALDAARRVNAFDVARGVPPSLTIDTAAFDGVRAWIDKMTDPETGSVGYQQRGSGSPRVTGLEVRFPASLVEGLTAVGVFTRFASGETADASAPLRSGIARIAALPPAWDEAAGSIDLYSWRLCAIAMARVGGEAGAAWRKALLTALHDHQRTDGDVCGTLGSWDPIDPWSPDGGRIYSTSMALLALLAPYSWEPPAAKPK